MKYHNKSLVFKLNDKRGFLSVTETMQQVVTESEVKNGLVLCSVIDNTTGLFIHINDESFLQDVDLFLHKLAPEKPYKQYAFNKGRTNAAAHIKSHLLGRQVTVAIQNGKLQLPPENHILFADFDGGTDKTVHVNIIGE